VKKAPSKQGKGSEHASKRAKKAAATFIITCSLAATTIGLPMPALAASPSTLPAQIGVAMTSEPQTSMNFTWTTLDAVQGPCLKVWKSNKRESTARIFAATAEQRAVSRSTITDEMGNPVLTKTFYSAKATGLKANTTYSYRVGGKNAMSEVRTFTTAPKDNGKYTFLYFSDSQIRTPSRTTDPNHSKSWQMNLEMAEATVPQAEFIYIAGDLTDKAQYEDQWEGFFNQTGNANYNHEFEGDLISNLPLAAAMGNHDSNAAGVGGMASHYLWDSDVAGVPVCYAFDYGAARMIILNLENAYSRDNVVARYAQLRFLTKEVKEAKSKGKWTIVGYHKALYSGANHMDDADVIFNRGYWTPKFAELDVDVILQGHDHVLSRGFVTKTGYKADVTRRIGERRYISKSPANAPLYYVGNGGSSLKFYAPIMSNAYILPGDPVAPDFGYLDINSALPAGYTNAAGKLLNPGPCTNDDLEGVDPSFFRAPTFTSISVTKGCLEFNTYMTGYDPYTDQIVADTFLYDSLKVTR
jgi:hypothetical protein